MTSRALSASSLPAWAAGFDRVHVDLGTGDGTYALDPVTAWKRNLAAIEPYLDRG